MEFCICLFIFLFLASAFPSGVSQAEEGQTFLWSDGTADAARFEKLCEERGIASADIFRVNGAPGRLVSIKLHSIPRKLRPGPFPVPVVPAPAPAGPISKENASAPPAPPPSTTPTPPPAAARTAPREAAAKDSKMTWPVNGRVTSGFGRRGKHRFHSGIDIPMPKGTPIRAAQDGIVLDVATNKTIKYRGYGNAALLGHGNGITTLYAHCQSVSVKKGQAVKRGDIVGLVGSTGRSTTFHLHFEVRKDGKAVNPLPYLASRQP
jgi:murein DD-endopeptidase MepM/ murein hydrolase activator NlpD